MQEEQISSDFTMGMLGIRLSVLAMILAAICYTVLSGNMGIFGWIIMISIIAAFALLIRRALSFADVYITSEEIIYRKIMGVKRRPLSEIRSVEEGMQSFTFYIEFKDNERVYFQLKPGDMFKRVWSWGPDEILNDIRKKLKLL